MTFSDLSNLRGHHLVSWLRMRDMSVMTVGGLVFSSDPRVQVTVVESIMEAGLSVYQLEVTNVTRGDRGQYQCQVILASDWSTDYSSVSDWSMFPGQHRRGQESHAGARGYRQVFIFPFSSKIISNSCRASQACCQTRIYRGRGKS